MTIRIIVEDESGSEIGTHELNSEQVEMLLTKLYTNQGIFNWIKGAVDGKVNNSCKKLAVEAKQFVQNNNISPSEFNNFSDEEFVRVMLAHENYEFPTEPTDPPQ